MQTTIIEEDEIDIKELFSVLKKHKKKILFFMLLFGLFAALFAYMKPNIYTASTTLEIESKKSSISSDDILNMAMNSDGVNVDTEIEIIKSRQLISHMLDKINFTERYYVTRNYREHEFFKDAPFKVLLTKGKGISFEVHPLNHQYFNVIAKGIDPETSQKWEREMHGEYGKVIKDTYFEFTLQVKDQGKGLSKQLSYRFVVLETLSAIEEIQKNLSAAQTSKQSSILKISYNDTVAVRAKIVTNMLAKEYLRQSIERKTEEASRTLLFIDKQLLSVNKSLQNSEQNLEKFKKKSSMLSVGSKADGIVEKLSDYETKLATAEIQEKMLTNLYNDIQHGKNLEEVSVIGLNLDKEGIPELIKQLQKSLIKKQVLSETYAPSHPEVKKHTLIIKQTKKRMISTLSTLKIRLSSHKKLLKKAINKYEKLMRSLPEKEKVFGHLLRSFTVNEKIYSYLLEKRAETAILKAATVNRNRILDTAIEVKKPIKPKRKLIVIVGLILGLIFGILLAFIREFLDDTINKVEDISKVITTPIIGTIPMIKKGAQKIAIFDMPKSALSEAFRVLRTNLQFISSSQESLIISVTSTTAGEGKTTLSTYLASIISLTDKKTIVVNFDMRKPTLHTKFSLPNNQGISSVLAGNISIEEVIQKTDYANLDIISSGPIPPNPSELILGEEMSTVIETLKSSYDVIVFDTPPVGLVSDAITLMHQSDINLYVIRAGYSKKFYLKEITSLLDKHKIKGFSLVLNALKEDKSKYGNGYGYYENG